MKQSYYLLTIVFVGIAFGLLFLNKEKANQSVNPEILLQQLNDPTRLIGIDEIAERMITGDPSYLLIDVRLSWDFEDYALPGAIHIPLAEIAYAVEEGKLNLPHKDIVFYSNGDITSNQARAIALQYGIKNTYVLEGGLNNWFSSIILDKAPLETASKTEHELYSFRKSVAVFLGMPLANQKSDENSVKPEVVELVKTSNNDAIAEEGC